MGDMDYSDLGREIGEKIEKFVNSKEIKDLQENIKTTVEKTMQDVSRSVKQAAEQVGKSVEIQWDRPGSGGPKTTGSGNRTESGTGNRGYGSQGIPYGPSGRRYGPSGSSPYESSGAPYGFAGMPYGPSGRVRNPYRSGQAQQKAPTGNTVRQRGNQRQLPVVRHPQGSASGVLFTLFGVVFGWAGLIGCLLKQFAPEFYNLHLLPFGLLIGISAVSLLVAFIGGFLRRRVRRFRKYVRIMGPKDFYPIEELAKGTGRDNKYTLRDLKKMIKRGWFPEGHLDEQETCFMLTNEAYALYQNAQEELKRRKEEAERLSEEQERLEKDPVLKQLKITVEEGKEYIRRIREVNDDIPGEDISQKLYRLEKITTRIFDYVQENPDKLSDIRRFMNYYLPTTLKLVESYHEFSIQPVKGENITTAQREIEEMLDEINGAFEKMFDQLFADDAMDISTDISVMSSMLKQEGLLESEFEQKKV